MAIPDYQALMLPLLQLASDGREHSLREAIEALATQFKLTEEERRTLLPSGRTAMFDNRVGWARTYLKKAQLLDSPRRGFFTLSSRGREVLDRGPSRIDGAFLEQFDEFQQFRNLRPEDSSPDDQGPRAVDATPEEQLEAAHQRL